MKHEPAKPDTTDCPTLGPPRLFIEVIREIGDTGQFVRTRKEISERVWRDAKYGPSIVANEMNACLLECEQYGR